MIKRNSEKLKKSGNNIKLYTLFKLSHFYSYEIYLNGNIMKYENDLNKELYDLMMPDDKNKYNLNEYKSFYNRIYRKDCNIKDLDEISNYITIYLEFKKRR